jgi:predicted phosphodiesterase
VSDGKLETRQARGLFLIPDPHLAGTPPMQRLDSYMDDILAKVAACLDEAARAGLVPVVLGDLFHWPRENPNSLMVALIELLRPHKPYVLVGNHDKYQARFTADTSLAVLDAAGVVRVLSDPGLFLRLDTPTGPALLGASPDGTPLPGSVAADPGVTTVWLAHHNIGFPDFQEKNVRIREIPGLDWVINGHIHRPQPTVTAGRTHWANPGNITPAQVQPPFQGTPPAAAIGACLDDLEYWPVPTGRSRKFFRTSLSARGGRDGEPRPVSWRPDPVGWRRTREGAGLKDFLGRQLQTGRPGDAGHLGIVPRGHHAPDQGRPCLRPTPAERELAGLKASYERLRDDKVRAEQDLSHLQNQLRELEAAAQAAYGTSDPGELEALLAAKRAENAQLVAAYREHIAAITRDLPQVEQDFEG